MNKEHFIYLNHVFTGEENPVKISLFTSIYTIESSFLDKSLNSILSLYLF